MFDEQGRYLGKLHAPDDVPLDRLTVHVALDEELVGVLKDELDVPYVVRLEILRG